MRSKRCAVQNQRITLRTCLPRLIIKFPSSFACFSANFWYKGKIKLTDIPQLPFVELYFNCSCYLVSRHSRPHVVTWSGNEWLWGREWCLGSSSKFSVIFSIFIKTSWVTALNLVPQGPLCLPSLFLSIFYTICVIFAILQKSFKIG